MKIVVVEGLDKSGKHTAVLNIANQLRSKGFSVLTVDFPNYSSEYGEKIRAYLYGDTSISASDFEYYQRMDKLDGQKQFDPDVYDFIIIDRFIHTQMAYAEYTTKDADSAYLNTEGIVRPDHVLFMDVSPTVSMARKGKHGSNDLYESDVALLTGVRDIFKRLFAEEPHATCHRIDADASLADVNQYIDFYVSFVLLGLD